MTNCNATMKKILPVKPILLFLIFVCTIGSLSCSGASATVQKQKQQQEEEEQRNQIVLPLNDEEGQEDADTDADGFVPQNSANSSVSPLRMVSSSSTMPFHRYYSNIFADADNSGSSSSPMLRGGSSGGFVGVVGDDDAPKQQHQQSPPPLSFRFSFPPIPPIHPHHSGSIHYSSIMKDGVVTYRRDINAPCDYGMLVFRVGHAAKELPYAYDLYEEAYLWSDNAGLCILYPSYDGYQVSSVPFWTLGVDPETVTFTNLIADPSSMHRVSSRGLKKNKKKQKKNESESESDEQQEEKENDNNSKIGDYIIMAKHNFYDVNYYIQLKAYINSW